MAATKTTLSVVGFLLFASILLQSMSVKASEHKCLWHPRGWGGVDGGSTSCIGTLMRWKYSEDRDDCEDWCTSFEESVGIECAQMNKDDDSKVYCACYSDCQPKNSPDD
ncbi:hypothetical protein MKW92_045802 [Papaver armeniacum]|nr:hypothetical protein MKW92_045802 [Papaver armeniacum]